MINSALAREQASGSAACETMGSAMKRVCFGATSADLKATVALEEGAGAWEFFRGGRMLSQVAETGGALWGGAGTAPDDLRVGGCM